VQEKGLPDDLEEHPLRPSLTVLLLLLLPLRRRLSFLSRLRLRRLLLVRSNDRRARRAPFRCFIRRTACPPRGLL